MREFLAAALGAACVSSFGQVPNGGFEVWPGECDLQAWAINSICEINLRPITKTTEAHSGSFAVRGEVVSLATVTMQPILQSGEDGTGFPISERYTSVDAFYRFAPLGGDRFGFNVIFQRGETVVAQGAKLFPATTGTEYDACSTPMVYFTDDVPSVAIIQVQIIGPNTGNDYHVGSVMYVDDVTFGAGVSEDEPRLSIVLNGNSVTVGWPQNVTGYRLQQTASLTAVSWNDVQGLSATDRAYTFTPTTQAYFRLIKP
jgi:hypothetical protein